jgi:hypothetical protein
MSACAGTAPAGSTLRQFEKAAECPELGVSRTISQADFCSF